MDSGSWGHEDTFIGTNEHIQNDAGDFAPHYGGMPWTSTWSTNVADNGNPNWPPTKVYEYLGTYTEPSPTPTPSPTPVSTYPTYKSVTGATGASNGVEMSGTYASFQTHNEKPIYYREDISIYAPASTYFDV